MFSDYPTLYHIILKYTNIILQNDEISFHITLNPLTEYAFSLAGKPETAYL